jgi:hypothetical protein
LNTTLKLIYLLWLTGITPALAEGLGTEPMNRQFTFSWPFIEGSSMGPRGGSTEGPAVTLDLMESDSWQRLREKGISDTERDRRAILAMAGGYRTSFEFIETIGFTPYYKPKRPYQAWGTEYVYVITNEPNFISLQHIIVMRFVTKENNVSNAFVVKHWRQDWQFEDTSLHFYVGDNTWKRGKLTKEEVAGKWSQSVFQTDDSPRYASVGKWEHHADFSSWKSANTWRPLPRREYSVRDDYHILSGTNRHTITPTGWVHEQDNLKLVLEEKGYTSNKKHYLAREAGLNRYERISEFDFAEGDKYWDLTKPFWTNVREAWELIFQEKDQFEVKLLHQDETMIDALFQYASQITEQKPYNPEDGKTFIEKTLVRFIN